MAKRYDNDFKVIISELLTSGRKVKEVSEEYGLSGGMIRRWRAEYEMRSGDFSKRNEPSAEKL